MHNKISDALEDNKNFRKEMRKLGPLLTMDDALHGFSPDKLNTHFSNISVSSQEDPTKSYIIISIASFKGISFQLVTANDTHENFFVHTTETVVDSTICLIVGPTIKFQI